MALNTFNGDRITHSGVLNQTIITEWRNEMTKDIENAKEMLKEISNKL